MLLSRVARVAAALLVSTVVVVGLPRPALAVDKYVGLTAGLGAQALAIGTEGKEVPAWYGAYSVGGATLPDTVTVKVDTSAARNVVTAKLADPKPAECSASDDGVITCTKKGDRRSEVQGDFLLVFTAADGAKINDRATITLTLSAPGQETKTLTHDLTIADSGPDLRARSFTRTTNPGGTVSFQPAFSNHGDRRGEMLMFELYAEPSGEFTDKFSNCRYAPQPSRSVAVCIFQNLNLEPGEVITIATPLNVKVKADVPNRTFVSYSGSTFSNNSTPSGPWDKWPLGTGPALGWERTQAAARDTTLDVDSTDNLGSLLITTSTNPSDVVANGAKVTGKVGDTVTVKLGLTNKGPALINGVSDSETSNPEDPYNAAFVAKFPTGVEVTKIENPAGDGHSCRGKVGDKYDDEANKPGRSEYRCMRWKIGVNETHTVTFTVKITAGVTAAGSIVARGGSSDPNTANNTAKIEFTGQDGLPITGPDAALTALVGALLVAAGCALVFVSRRRGAAAPLTQ